MKKRIGFIFLGVVICLFCAASLQAQQVNQSVTFAWEPNTEPDLKGYRLYRSDVPGQYIFGKGKEVLEILKGKQTATITGSVPGYFVLTAFDNDGFESKPSIELNTFPPVKPNGFKITILVE